MVAIGPALADIKLGHASKHGFRALFKYDGAREYVEDTLSAVVAMRPQRALEPWPQQPTRPQFSCVTYNVMHLHPFLHLDLWQLCQYTSAAAFYASGSSFIFLCPRFFHYPEKPDDLSGRNCPEVENNRFSRNERNLYEYQTYIIIHEMVHFYLQGQSLSGISEPPEQYGLDGCVALSPMNSLHNPTNYQAYVASTYTPVDERVLGQS